MMNTRTRNAPARIACGRMNHHEVSRLRCIRYQRSASGPRVLAICQSARKVEGIWYWSTISLQAAVSAGGPLPGSGVGIAIAVSVRACLQTGFAPGLNPFLGSRRGGGRFRKQNGVVELQEWLQDDFVREQHVG